MGRESIAIVGIGCRLPGDVDSPEDLRTFLQRGQSAIVDVPADRWNRDAFFHPDFQRPGSIHVRRGGFVSSIDQFDAAFFGISPNEARRMDPQQRMMLESAFRAIEDAGVPLERLAGKPVAVAIGVSLCDWNGITGGPSERANIGATTNTGSSLSILANRVSYLFDLRGPSFVVDTACSSSITALHYACRAIWEGSACAALVGGVNAILKPEITMGFSKGGYLSPDAVCRTFSDDANGYVRSEGAAMVLLKPLSQAIADGDRIYASIRGTWVNQDGRTGGITVPSQRAQEELLSSAFADASVDPARACYIEAHGTGTPTGDPIEAAAIGQVVGKAAGRREPLWVGSIKTNIGHMESAAGMGGLIKLALVLQGREIFPNLNFRRANPKIDLEALRLRVPTERAEIPGDGPLFGGVNAFGFGGANAHAILETPPPSRKPRPSVAASPSPSRDEVVVLSARSARALSTLAAELAQALQTDGADVGHVAAALARRRSRFEFRLAQVGKSATEIATALAQYASSGNVAERGYAGRVAEGKVVSAAFVFTGQGAQWHAMGRDLLENDPIARATVDEIGAELERLGWLRDERSTLRKELLRDKASSRMSETRIAQPCIFALEVAITRVLAARGVFPVAVVGHSIGELPAAVAAGVLSLAEATRVVYWRSQCQAQAEGAGAMAALGVSAREALELVAKHAGEVEVAAYNGPRAVTIAGTHAAVDAIVADATRREVFSKKLDVSVPFHCQLMDPIEPAFRRGLGPVAASVAEKVAFYSTVTGKSHPGSLDLDYWYDNIRRPVRFASALKAMLDAGIQCFVEIGPHAALMHGSIETIREAGARAVYVPTLRRDGDDAAQIASSLAQLFAAGVSCEPSTGMEATHVTLPRHSFEKQRFWLESREGMDKRLAPEARIHPHIGAVEKSAHADGVFSCKLLLDPRVDGYLSEHRAQGHIVFPAAGQIEVLTAVGRHVFGPGIAVEDVEFRRPMVLSTDPDEAPTFRLDVYADDGNFMIASRIDADAAWVEHTRGRIRRIRRPEAPQRDLEALSREISVPLSVSGMYRTFAQAGLELGPTFKCLTGFFRNESRTEFLSTSEPHASMANERFFVHPALLDATIQAAMPVEPERSEAQPLFLPQRCARVLFLGGDVPKGRIWAHVRKRWTTSDEVCLDVDVMNDVGGTFARFEGLVARLVHGSAMHRGNATLDHVFRPSPREGAGAPPRAALAAGAWLIFETESSRPVARAVDELFQRVGSPAVRVFFGAKFERRDERDFVVRPDAVEDMSSLVAAVGRPIAGVVDLASLDATESPSGAALLSAVPLSHLADALTKARAWSDAAREIWLVTRGAVSTNDDERNPRFGGATTWGFGRVLMSEQARLTTTLVDLPDSPTTADVDALVREITEGARDPEVALRGPARWARTLVRDELKVPMRRFDVATSAVRAVVRSPGVIDSVRLEEFHLHEIDPDGVEIAVRATGLNFRDVAFAMNLVSKIAWEGGLIGQQLALDAAGVVTRVGAAVTKFRPGDAVLGFFPESVATRSYSKERYVAKLPPGLSFGDAAALPIPFLTADTALRELAKLSPGETVLIHAAAGGVGCIAVQLAHHLGATVIATTSSEEKRAFLRELGVKHIFNSRTADFGDEILALTNGEGVDVVLNSLAGRALTESFRCLKAFGRFIEIGKTDIYKNRQVGLFQFAKNKSYFCLDVNVPRPKGDLGGVLLRALEARTSGIIKTVPLKTFPLSEAAAALHCLAQGKQIGKVIVEVPPEGGVLAEPLVELRLESEGVYLVTGGCGGFGLALAERLAARGARSLTLVGRRGVVGEDEEKKVQALRAAGISVDVRRADVSRRDQVEALIRYAQSRGGLAGVFHAAAVFDDAPLTALDRERYARVLDAKAEAALLLHETTRGIALDWFVLFSSISGVIGTPGQANYAAANAYLDELASFRRASGQPAISVSFGAIEDVGFVARAPKDQQKKILGQGVRGLDSRRALDLLERVMVEGRTRRIVAEVDVRRLAQLGDARRRFAELLGGGQDDATRDGSSLRGRLRDLSEEARPAMLALELSAFLSRIAGLGDNGVDPETSLTRYGLDSLMVAQLQNWMETELGLTMTMVRLMRGPSATELARELLAQLSASAASANDDASVLKLLGAADPARFALVCFPPMGAERDVFAAWLESLPPGVSVYGFELPSIDGPNAELLTQSSEDQLAGFADALAALGDVPFAFYGHSMGAYVALVAARSLRERGARAPSFVMLGAVPEPGALADFVPRDVTSPSEITPSMVEEAVRWMRQQSGDSNGALAPAMLDRVRRDLWVSARSRGTSDAEVIAHRDDQPILVGGGSDPVRTVDKLPAATRVGFGYDETLIVKGGHMFFLEPEGRDAVTAAISQRILRELGGREG